MVYLAILLPPSAAFAPRKEFFHMQHRSICPFCGSDRVIGNGVGRWLCQNCNRSFSRTTGTVASSRKLGEGDFTAMLNLMINDVKLKAIIDSVGISSRTAYVWRMKVYTAAFELQKAAMLSGKVWIDEAFVPINEGSTFRFMDGKRPRGVSRNQVAIACAVDSNGTRYAAVAGLGHITSSQCLKTYGAHIKGGSMIIHDGIFSHDALVRRLGGRDEVWKSTASGSHKALQPVNSFISEIKHYLSCHGGIRTRYLGLYVAWVAFKASINGDNIAEKIRELEAICYKTNAVFRVKDRY